MTDNEVLDEHSQTVKAYQLLQKMLDADQLK